MRLHHLLPSAALLVIAFVSGCSSKPRAFEAGLSTRELSLDSMKALREAGVRSVEVTLADIVKLPEAERPARCAQVATDAKKAGVRLWSGHIPFGGSWDISVTDPAKQAAAMAKVRETIDLCRRLGLQKAVIHASAEPIKDDQRAARFAVARKALEALTPEFAAAGVQLALEDLPRTCLGNTSEEIIRLVDGIEGLGVCFDTNHTLKETPQAFVGKVGGRIVTLHVADYDGVDERHWMAGDGIVDWPAVAKALGKAGYRGPFLYETSKHKDGKPIQLPTYTGFAAKMRREARL